MENCKMSGCTADRENVQCTMCSVNDNGGCMCGCVGYAYVPWQMIGEVTCPEKALCSGTAFPELELTIDEYGNVCKKEGEV